MIYLWIKAVHVVAIIAWMAAMLYLPRLFVYHTAAPAGSAQSETFKVMERRLLRAIMTPAMIAAIATGLYLATVADWWTFGWLHAKVALVAVLAVMHGLMARWAKDFAADRNRRGDRFYRVMNEVPTLLMVLIVILVVVKPF